MYVEGYQYQINKVSFFLNKVLFCVLKSYKYFVHVYYTYNRNTINTTFTVYVL